MTSSEEKDKEIEKLRKIIASYEANKVKQQRFTRNFATKTTQLIYHFLFGKKLKDSIHAFLKELSQGKVSQDTSSELIANIIIRLTRVGFFALIGLLIPFFFLVFQTNILLQQNKLMERQNSKFDFQNNLVNRQNGFVEQQNNLVNKQNEFIEQQNSKFDFQNSLVDKQNILAGSQNSLLEFQNGLLGSQNSKFDFQNNLVTTQNRLIEIQNYLNEANRQSSLIFLFNNIMDKVNEELQENPNERKLSPQLIGRIVALANSFKPYRFLEEDSLSNLLSPERGQLLITLLGSKLDTSVYDQIFREASFEYADLRGANLTRSYLKRANLRKVNLNDANLNKAILDSIDLQGANLNQANLTSTSLKKANLSNATLVGTDLKMARLDSVILNGADLSNASFKLANLVGAGLDNTNLNNTDFFYANLTQAFLGNTSFKTTGSLRFITLENARTYNPEFLKDFEVNTSTGSEDISKVYILKEAYIQRELKYYLIIRRK